MVDNGENQFLLILQHLASKIHYKKEEMEE
jgi:hypothetical protein